MTELDRIIADERELETSDKGAKSILDSAADVLKQALATDGIHSSFINLNLALSVAAATGNSESIFEKLSATNREWKNLCVAMMLTGSAVTFNHMIQREAMKLKGAGEKVDQ